MVRLDYERLHFAQAFNRKAGGVPEIGDVAKRTRAGVKGVADRLNRVVWNGETFHRDIADRKTRPRPENAKVAVFA